jgi:hypothetical protein
MLIRAIYLRAELNASGSRNEVQREKGAQAHRTKRTGLVENSRTDSTWVFVSTFIELSIAVTVIQAALLLPAVPNFQVAYSIWLPS